MTTSLLAVTLWVPAMIIFGVALIVGIAWISISSSRAEKKAERDKQQRKH